MPIYCPMEFLISEPELQQGFPQNRQMRKNPCIYDSDVIHSFTVDRRNSCVSMATGFFDCAVGWSALSWLFSGPKQRAGGGMMATMDWGQLTSDERLVAEHAVMKLVHRVV